jgi:hypothetical protein
MTKSYLALGVLAFTTTAASAADIGPPIAYSVGRNLYLASADGSSTKLLFTAARRKSIFAVQLKPGGGEVAFEETACCTPPTSSLLKIVRFDNSGTRVGTPASITVCGRVAGLAYHPTDGTVLYTSTCDQPTKRLNTTSMTSTAVTLPHSANYPSWLPNGTEFIYAAMAKIWRVSIANTNSPTAIGDANCVQSLDAGSVTSRALWTDACAGTVNLLNFSTGQSTALRQGASAYFSPTDVKYAYLSPQTTKGGYLLISNVDGSGTETRIGSRAKYLSVDWRK